MNSMNSLIVIEDAPELKKVDESKALQIKNTFEPMAQLVYAVEGERQKVLEAAKQGITKEVMADAKKLGAGVARIRIDTEKKRVAMKKEFLVAGQAVDGASNVLKHAIAGIENEMKEIVNHYENLEKKRLVELQAERVELISPYLEDAGERDLASMDTDVWDSYLSTKKQAHEDLVAAEEKAEADRIAKEEAEAKEQERIRLEKEQLKKDAEVKAAQDKIDADKREEDNRIERERLKKEDEQRELQRQKEIRDSEKLEKDRVAKEKVEREERESKDREEQKERSRIAQEKQKAHEAELKAERDEKQKLTDDLKAKEDAAAKVIAEAETARQAELSKGDTEKVADLIADLKALKTKYSFESKINKTKYSYIQSDLDIAIERLSK